MKRAFLYVLHNLFGWDRSYSISQNICFLSTGKRTIMLADCCVCDDDQEYTAPDTSTRVPGTLVPGYLVLIEGCAGICKQFPLYLSCHSGTRYQVPGTGTRYLVLVPWYLYRYCHSSTGRKNVDVFSHRFEKSRYLVVVHKL